MWQTVSFKAQYDLNCVKTLLMPNHLELTENSFVTTVKNWLKNPSSKYCILLFLYVRYTEVATVMSFCSRKPVHHIPVHVTAANGIEWQFCEFLLKSIIRLDSLVFEQFCWFSLFWGFFCSFWLLFFDLLVTGAKWLAGRIAPMPITHTTV